jgi:hypothetical protein
MDGNIGIDGMSKSEKDNQPKRTNRIPGIFREIVAIFFWLYLISKVFIFDFDIYLAEKIFPEYGWIIQYRFFILLFVLAVIFLLTKNRNIVVWSLYILLYPFVVLVWKIPFFIFNQGSWNLAIASIDSLISFFVKPKFRFVKTSFFIVSMAVILFSPNKTLIWCSIFTILIIIILAYIERVTYIIKPTGVYQIYFKVISFYAEAVKNSPLSPTEEDIEKFYSDDIEIIEDNKIVTSIQQLVLCNRLCLFVSKKLKVYKDSRFGVLSNILGILFLVLFTVLSFAFINLGLVKINPDYFIMTQPLSFFIFFYYSFNALVFNSIREIIPNGVVPQIFSMIEFFCAFFLAAIFVTLIFSFKYQKESDELEKVINQLSLEGEKIEVILKDRFRYNSINEAMEALEKFSSAVTDMIYKITNSI